MKKVLFMLLLVCMILTALSACGNSDVPPVDDPQDTSKTPFTPEIIPAEKFNPRQVVIDYMYKMSKVEWIPKTNIDFTETISGNLHYDKGVKYTGIMYVTGKHLMTDYDEFMEQLDEKGVYIGPTDQPSAYGNHCSSALRLSYDQIVNTLGFTSTVTMVPSQKRGTIPVGDYVFDDSDKTTDSIVQKNSKEKMFECYALLQPGDSILTCWGPTGHSRMVLEVKVEKTGAGKINPSKSTVTTIEQTSSFDSTRKDVKTTWYVEHVYSFTQLFSTNYIPLTIEELNKEAKDTEFSVKNINTAKNVTSGKLQGVIRSSFLLIQSVTVDYIDSNGNVVATGTYKNPANLSAEKITFQFNDVKAPEGVTSLPAGNYTYNITANTIYGSAKVAVVDFTVE